MDFMNWQKLAQLEREAAELAAKAINLQQTNRTLKASNTAMLLRRTPECEEQKALSEITPRNPLNYTFEKYCELFNTTMGKRIMGIGPRYAMSEPPIIADVNTDGSIRLDTPFVEDVKRIMQSRRGTSTVTPSLFDGNFGGYEAVTNADIMSYGKWGGIYFVFENDNKSIDDPKTDPSEGPPKKLIGMYPLDQSQMSFTTPTKGFNIEKYDITVEGQSIQGVDHRRIVHITDTDGFEHVPRMVPIEYELRNANGMMLSLMASIAISRPKIAAVVDAMMASESTNFSGEDVLALIQTIRDSLKGVIDDERTGIKNKFIKELTLHSAEMVDFGRLGSVDWSERKGAKSRTFNNRIKEKPSEDRVFDEFKKIDLNWD